MRMAPTHEGRGTVLHGNSVAHHADHESWIMAGAGSVCNGRLGLRCVQREEGGPSTLKLRISRSMIEEADDPGIANHFGQ